MTDEIDFTPGAIEAADELVNAFERFARHCEDPGRRIPLWDAVLWDRIIERVATYRRIRWAMTLTWTCHVCGDERPDNRISVRKSVVRSPSLHQSIEQSVRYCNDRPACVQGSFEVRFIHDSTLTFQDTFQDNDEREGHG